MDWFSNLFTNTLGSEGLGGLAMRGLSALTPTVAADQVAQGMNSGALAFDNVTGKMTDTATGEVLNMANTGALYSNPVGAGLAATSGKDLFGMATTGAGALANWNASKAQEKLNDTKIAAYNDEKLRRDKQIAQSARIW